MEVVIKAFMGIFFSLVLVVLGIGMISAAMDGRNANSFASACTARIENSGCSQAVIEVCKRDAAKKGYEFQVWLDQGEGVVEQIGRTQLTYQIQIPIIGLSREFHVLSTIY